MHRIETKLCSSRLEDQLVFNLHETVEFINKKLHMPGIPLNDEEQLLCLAKDFQISRRVASPLFGCVGALDGICIEISKQKDDYVPRKFYCRKGMYAIPVQAVVNSAYMFMYMSATCAGSTHDSVALGLPFLGS